MHLIDLLLKFDWNHKYTKIWLRNTYNGQTYYRGPVRKLSDMQKQVRVDNWETYMDGHCLTVYVQNFPKFGGVNASQKCN